MPRLSATAYKAQIASALVPELIHAIRKNDLEVATDVVQRLCRLYPKARLQIMDGEIFVFVREGSFGELGRALLYGASYVEEVLYDGSAIVHKDRNGVHGPIPESIEHKLGVRKSEKRETLKTRKVDSRTWYEWLDSPDSL